MKTTIFIDSFMGEAGQRHKHHLRYIQHIDKHVRQPHSNISSEKEHPIPRCRAPEKETSEGMVAEGSNKNTTALTNRVL